MQQYPHSYANANPEKVHVRHNGKWKFDRLWKYWNQDRMEFQSRTGFLLASDCKSNGWEIVPGWACELAQEKAA